MGLGTGVSATGGFLPDGFLAALLLLLLLLADALGMLRQSARCGA